LYLAFIKVDLISSKYLSCISIIGLEFLNLILVLMYLTKTSLTP